MIHSLILLSLLPLSSAPHASERIERRLAAMGTQLVLRVEAPTRAEALRASERAVRAIEACEECLCTWRDDTELARLNRAPLGERFELSAQLARMLGRAGELSRATQGAFDPGIGGLVQAWGLRVGGREPAADEIERALAVGGLAGLELDGHVAIRRAPVTLEEGAFGKGAGLDAALAALIASGATGADLDLGGQWLVHGGPVTLGVAHPRARDRVVLTTVVEAGSVATTGNSERAIVVAGQRRSHVLDPRSGRPVDDWGSVTVHAPDALTADALSTGLFVLGPDAALAYADAHEGIEVLTLEWKPSNSDGCELIARASDGWVDWQRLDETLQWQAGKVLGSR